MRLDRQKYADAIAEHSEEKYRQVVTEADRHQQQDQEKKQRGERVKPAEQQANDLHAKYLCSNTQRTKERELLKQQADEQSAEDQQPASDSSRRDESDEEVEQHPEVEQRPATDNRPAAEHRPADDSAKSNPDIASSEVTQFARPAEKPPAARTHRANPNERSILDDVEEDPEDEPIGMDEPDE